MKKLLTTLFYCLIFVSPLHTMELVVSEKEMPYDIGTHVFHSVLLYFHNLVENPLQARDYLVSVSRVNKYCNELANNPHVIKKIISNLSATLRYYEERIAKELNTSSTQKYIAVNNQIFSEHLKKSDVIKLLQEGLDPNYRRQVHIYSNHSQFVTEYDGSRHFASGMPLTFFVTGTTDNDVEIAKCLLEHGADINKSANSTNLPLELAIYRNLPKMVEVLLCHNQTFAKYSIFCGRTYLEQAIQQDYSEIIDLIIEHAPASVTADRQTDFKRALKAAILKKNIPLIQKLLANGATPDIVLHDVLKATLLHPYPLATTGDGLLFGAFHTTDMLQLLCDNGITEQTRTDALAYARQAKQRVEEVISILSPDEYEYDDLPDLIPGNIKPIEDNV